MIYEPIINRATVRVKILFDPAQITRIRSVDDTISQTLLLHFSFYIREILRRGRGKKKKKKRKERPFLGDSVFLKTMEEKEIPRFYIRPHSLKVLRTIHPVREKYAKRASCIITTLPGTH